MREILFRGKRISGGEWLYGSLLTDNRGQKHIIPFREIYMDGHHVCIESDWPQFFDQQTIGQYTGLLDKHGRKIFEGDIIKITDHTIEETFESCGELVTMLMTRTYEVFWNTTKWSIKLIEPMLGVDPPIFDLPTKNVTYEIIGNIHDQKEGI